MKIEPTTQPKSGPKDKPILRDPVKVTLDAPVWYLTAKGPTRASRTLTCDRAHALLVYGPLNDWAVKYGFAIVHIGTYYPRKARTQSGKTILYNGRPRWSGHSWGAIDFAGVIASDGKFYDTNDLKAGAPAKFEELYNDIKAAVQQAGRTLEYVTESHWRHVGLVPAGGW